MVCTFCLLLQTHLAHVLVTLPRFRRFVAFTRDAHHLYGSRATVLMHSAVLSARWFLQFLRVHTFIAHVFCSGSCALRAFHHAGSVSFTHGSAVCLSPRFRTLAFSQRCVRLRYRLRAHFSRVPSLCHLPLRTARFTRSLPLTPLRVYLVAPHAADRIFSSSRTLDNSFRFALVWLVRSLRRLHGYVLFGLPFTFITRATPAYRLYTRSLRFFCWFRLHAPFSLTPRLLPSLPYTCLPRYRHTAVGSTHFFTFYGYAYGLYTHRRLVLLALLASAFTHTTRFIAVYAFFFAAGLRTFLLARTFTLFFQTSHAVHASHARWRCLNALPLPHWFTRASHTHGSVILCATAHTSHLVGSHTYFAFGYRLLLPLVATTAWLRFLALFCTRSRIFFASRSSFANTVPRFLHVLCAFCLALVVQRTYVLLAPFTARITLQHTSFLRAFSFIFAVLLFTLVRFAASPVLVLGWFCFAACDVPLCRFRRTVHTLPFSWRLPLWFAHHGSCLVLCLTTLPRFTQLPCLYGFSLTACAALRCALRFSHVFITPALLVYISGSGFAALLTHDAYTWLHFRLFTVHCRLRYVRLHAPLTRSFALSLVFPRPLFYRWIPHALTLVYTGLHICSPRSRYFWLLLHFATPHAFTSHATTPLCLPGYVRTTFTAHTRFHRHSLLHWFGLFLPASHLVASRLVHAVYVHATFSLPHTGCRFLVWFLRFCHYLLVTARLPHAVVLLPQRFTTHTGYYTHTHCTPTRTHYRRSTASSFGSTRSFAIFGCMDTSLVPLAHTFYTGSHHSHVLRRF